MKRKLSILLLSALIMGLLTGSAFAEAKITAFIFASHSDKEYLLGDNNGKLNNNGNFLSLDVDVEITVKNQFGSTTYTGEELATNKATVAFSSNILGLKYTESTGKITGKPEKVTDSGTIKVAVTSSDGKTKNSTTLTVKVTGTAPTLAASTDKQAGKNGTDADNARWLFLSGDKKPIIGGTVINKNNTPFKFVVSGSVRDLKLTAKISPAGSGLTFTTDPIKYFNNVDKASGSITGYFTGTVPAPGKEGKYTITVVGSNSGTTDQSAKKVTKYYSFDIIERPTIKTLGAKDIKSGTPSFTAQFAPKTTTGTSNTSPKQSWDIYEVTGDKSYLTKADLRDLGLSFDRANGKLSGKWVSNDTTAVSFDTANKLTKKLKIVLTKVDAGNDSGDYALTFVAQKPVILNSSTIDSTSNFFDSADKLILNKEVDDNKFFLQATGPGKITWTVDSKLPKGLEYTTEVSGDLSEEGTKVLRTSVLRFSGAPLETVKDLGVKITATNAGGTATITPKFTVSIPNGTFNFDETSADLTKMGGWAVGANIDTAALDDVKSDDTNYSYNAEGAGRKIFTVNAPGKLKWTAENLPKGIKLITSGDSQAYLSGTFTKAQDWKAATISAYNKDLNVTTKTLRYDFRVFAAPKISTKKLGNDASGTMEVGDTNQKWTLAVKDNDGVTSWDIDINGAGSNEVYDEGQDTGYALTPAETEEGAEITGKLSTVPEGNALTVVVTATNPAGSDTKTYTVKVTGEAIEMADKDWTVSTKPTEDQITEIAPTKGTLPITLSAYIDAKQAKKLFGVDNQIDLSQEDNVSGIVFEAVDGEDATTLENVKGTFTYSAEANKEYKDLKITVAAENAMTTKKPVTATVTFNLAGTEPSLALLSSDGDFEAYSATGQEKTIDAIAGSEVGYRDEDFALKDAAGYVIGVIGTEPLEIDFSPASVNGLTMALRDPEVGDSETYYKELYISGTPTAGKTTKSKFKVTLTNLSTKTKFKGTLTVQALMPPEMQSKAKDLKQEIEMGHKLSVAAKAKGYGTITWQLDESATGEFDSTNDYVSELADYNITFTSNDGKFVAEAKDTIVPTLNDDENAYATKKYYIRAKNIAGYSDAELVELGVKGAKPTLKTTSITINRGSTVDLTAEKYTLTSDLTKYSKGDNRSADVKYLTASDKDTTTLENLGLALQDTDSQNNGTAYFEGEDFVATKAKGTNVNLTLNNYATTNKGKITVIINDPSPDIEADDTSLSIEAGDKKVTATTTLALTEATQGTSKNKWEITKDGKPGQTDGTKGIAAAIKADKDAQSAVLTITIPAKFNPAKNTSPVTDSVTVRVTNPETKAYDDIKIALSVTPYNEETSEAPEDEADAKDEADVDETETDGDDEELERGEGDVILGEARTEAALTAGERAAIEAQGYLIAAVLPEVTVTEDGFYDLDAVALVEETPEGAELVWFAFPRNAAASEDDEIAEFYDEAGAEIKVVPAELKVVPAAWFNADVTYAPVIAVKVPAAGEEVKDTADDAEAGDVVAIEALEEAE